LYHQSINSFPPAPEEPDLSGAGPIDEGEKFDQFTQENEEPFTSQVPLLIPSI